MKDKGKRKSEVIFLTILIATGISYFFLFGESSYVIHKDTAAFVEWSYDVPFKRGYVVYTTFLKICRMVFGESTYFQAVNIIQCSLALITTLILEEYTRKTYNLGYCLGYLSFLLICGVYGYSLPEVVASHYIVTESVAFPLFSLMLVFLLKYINEHTFLPLFSVCALCLVMANIRPQMAFFVPILIFIFLCNELALLCTGRNVKKRTDSREEGTTGSDEPESIGQRSNRFIPMLVLFGLAVATAVGLYLVVLITVHLFSGYSNSQYHEAVTGKVMCVMKEADSGLYEEPIVAGYEALYRETADIGGLSENFPESILEYEKVQCILDENMKKGLNVLWRWYRTIQEPVDRKMAYELRNRIISTELDEHKTEYIGIVLRLMLSSLVSSIFIQPQKYRLICNIVALGIYFAAVLLICLAYNKKIDRKYCFPAFATLIMIYGNSLLCNVVLYGQQRYVIYCFGIFYISVMIIIKGLFEKASQDVKQMDD